MLLRLCFWLQHNSWLLAVNSSVPISAALEAAHYAGFFLLVGSTAIVDLRLMAVAGRRFSPSALAGQLFPWAWTGFAFTLVSGFFMFSGDAVDFYRAPIFRLKLLVILLAALFGLLVQWKAPQWDRAPAIPAGAKVAAFLSLALWIGAILASVEVPAISGVG